ncbi:MAG: DUF5723 family protein [Candidatus Amulumruptor caecigallinarius]|nr:DUF5723 family protein [Candidatus Amulumruptor caecigallinarius]MCM1395974.1 DUF5723 family protein [Candidatus Amulumruptor caecigallinarius]MCM1453006.1 DUF5723 family protein [bacterium]
MKLHKTLMVAGVAAALSVTADAQQNTYSGYFIEGNLYRHQLNPAFGNDSLAYVAFPGLGNLNVGMHGNLHVDDILYNVNGRTTTFLNPAVDAGSFLSSLKDHNKVGADINIPILSGGFKAWGGYNTVSISARATVNASIPRSVFSLLKEGATNQTYDISDVRGRAYGYAELAFGHSRQITPKWRVGGKLKVLLGGADVDMKLSTANLTLGTDNWTATTDAEIRSSVKGLKYKTDVNDHTGHRYVSGMDVDGTGINGFGLGFDLGAAYTLNADWSFSAAVQDLGFIHWANDMLASTNGVQTFQTAVHTFSADGDAPNSFDNEWKKIRNELSALYELNDCGDAGGRTTGLNATINLAAQYTLPYYRKLTFGLLNSTRIAGKFTTTDFRLSANVAPVKVFSAGANFAVGTYGCSFGWMLNAHPKYFNFFIAMDHTLGKLAKQGLPLSSNGSINMGINFPF